MLEEVVKPYHETVLEGGEIVEITEAPVVDEVEVGDVKIRDKRSGLVDRRRAVRQVLCYICCAEFGTSSLAIHQKTCLKKHKWGLDIVENEEGVPKKKAAMNRKKCIEPSSGPAVGIPGVKSSLEHFTEYNAQALRIFHEHAENCLWCRERNTEAIENAKHASASAAPAVNEPGNADDEEDSMKRALEEEELHKRAEADEEEHRLAEEAARLQHEKELEALRAKTEEASRIKAAEDARKKKEADDQLKAEEEEHQRQLRAEQDEAKKSALAEKRRLENAAREAEEELRRQAQESLPEDEDEKMIRIIREEEAARRAAAEEEQIRKKKVAIGKYKYLHKNEGVQAYSQAAAVYEDHVAAEAAKRDIANMSLSHAKKEGLIQDAHKEVEEESMQSSSMKA